MGIASFHSQYSIRILDQSDRNAIVELRRKAFSAKYGPSVDLNGLHWNQTDQMSTHIGAHANSRLISVLRLSYIESNESFESILRFPATDSFASVPSFSLARAATDLTASGRGINLSLRLEAYRQILLNPRNARYIFGTTLFDASRIRLLKEIGYEVTTHTNSWQGYLKSGEKAISVFRLSMENIEPAMEKLNQAILKTNSSLE